MATTYRCSYLMGFAVQRFQLSLPAERCVQNEAYWSSSDSPACVSSVMDATHQSPFVHARLASSWKSSTWNAITRKNALWHTRERRISKHSCLANREQSTPSADQQLEQQHMEIGEPNGPAENDGSLRESPCWAQMPIHVPHSILTGADHMYRIPCEACR